MSLARFRKPIVASSEAELVSVAAGKMRDAHVGCVVVVRKDKPVGLVTDRDIVLRVVAEGRDPTKTRMIDVVTPDPFMLDETDTAETAALRMREHGVRRLPIVDASGRVVGIVSADDLLAMLGRQLADVCAGIEDAADGLETK